MLTERPFTKSPALVSGVGIIGLALVVMAEELLGYCAFDVASLDIDSYLVLCVVQAAFACPLALGVFHAGDTERLARLLLAIMAACCSAAIVILLCTANATLDGLALLGGFAFLDFGLCAAKAAFFLLLSDISALWRKRIILGAFLLQSLFSPLALQAPVASLVATMACALGSAVSLVCSWNCRTALTTLANQTRLVPDGSSSFALGASLFVIMMALGFMNPLDIYSDMSGAAFLASVFVTHFCALVVWSLCAFRLEDLSNSFSMRLAMTLVSASLLIYCVQMESLVPATFMCVGVTSFLEIVMFHAMTDYASYASTPRLRVFGGYCFIVRLATALGLVIREVGKTSLDSEGIHQAVALVFIMAIFIIAVWIATPEALNRFFWGDAVRTAVANPHDAAISPEPTLEQKTAYVADCHGLTKREQEVLGLLAVGRSSTFIAQELFLSSNTVRKHVSHIYAKCGVHSKQELLTLIQSASPRP